MSAHRDFSRCYSRSVCAALILLATLCCSVVPIIAKTDDARQSYAPHRASNWYRELQQSRPNARRLRQALDADSSVRNGQRSLEWKEAVRWLAYHWHLVDRDGWLADSLSDPEAMEQRLRKRLGDVEQQQHRWTSIGPYTWDRSAKAATGSMGLGVVRSMAVDHRQPAHVFAGTISAGLWKSTNNGGTWTNVTDPLPVTTVSDIAIAPSQSRYIYAATNVGVVRSINAGQTFTICDPANAQRYPVSTQASHVAVHPMNPLVVVASYGDRLQRSADGGFTWTRCNGGDGPWWDLQWHPTDPLTLYALRKTASWVEFYRSTDGGISFSPLPGNGLPTAVSGGRLLRGCLATSALDSSRVWVILAGQQGDTLGGLWGLYTSYDAGATFSHVCCGPDGVEPADADRNPNLFDYSITGSGVGQVTWDMAFDVSSTDTSLMVAAGIFPYVSTDAGRTWRSTASIHYDIQDAHLVGRDLWVSHDGGLHLSQDSGKTFTDRSDGINSLQVWGIGTSHRSSIMAVGAYHMPIILRDDELYQKGSFVGGWYGWSGADAMSADVNPDDDRWIYAKPWNSVRAERSSNAAIPPRSQDLGIDLGYLPFTNVAFDPHETYRIVAADHRSKSIVSTLNNATSWDTLKTFASSVSHVRISPHQPMVYAAIGDDELWMTTDAGRTWELRTPPRSVSGSAVVSDVQFGDSADEIWVSYGGRQAKVKVLVSTNRGTTWRDASYGLPAVSLRCLAPARTGTGRMYAGTELGVYTRTAADSVWSVYGEALPFTTVSFLRVDHVQGTLIAATERGVWQIPLAETSAPRACIARDRSEVRCASTRVRYVDRSDAQETVFMTRQWLFPGGQPAASTDVQVDVTYATPGVYDAILVVQNEHGRDSTVLRNAVRVYPSECDLPDPTPGRALDLRASADRVRLARIDTVLTEATFMAWVRLFGEQPDFSAVFCTDGVDNSQEFGMQIFSPSHEIGYLWSGGRWWWRSGLRLTPGRWHHVAVIVRPTGATVMVDGVSATDRTSLGPVDFSGLDLLLGTYHLWSTRNAAMEIDEIRWFAQALHPDDVRRTMHHPIPSDMPGLLAWYQVNESDESVLYDRRSGMMGHLEGGARHVQSTIPYAPGRTVVRRDRIGRWIPTDTTWCGVELTEDHSRAIMITRLETDAATIDTASTWLGPEFWIRDVEGTSAVTTTRVALHQIIAPDDARRRSWSMWKSSVDSVSAPWQPLSSVLSYQQGSHVVDDDVLPAAATPLRIRLQVGGGPVSVTEDTEDDGVAVHLSPLPAADVVTAKISTEKINRLLIVAMDGRVMPPGYWTSDGAQISIDVQHLPAGQYILVVNQHRVLLPILR